MLPSCQPGEEQRVPLNSQSHEFTFSYFQTWLPELWCRHSCQDANWGMQVQVQEPGDAPAPCQPSTGILAPNVLILHLFSCVSQSRKLNSTVSQGKTHFRFGATARTRLLTHVSAHALGKSFSLFIPWLPCLQKQVQ